MEKVIVTGCGIVAVFVFGSVFVVAALNFIWALMVLIFPYVFWTVVAVGCCIGAWVCGRGLAASLKQERVQREAEEQRLTIASQQRAELEALYSQVRYAYHDLFDAERRRSQPRIGR